VYQKEGKLEQALEYYRKDLEIKIQVLGHEHTDVATCKYNMAIVHEVQGNLERARLLFLECQSIYAEIFGADHEETLDAAMRAETVGQDSGSDNSGLRQ